MKNLAPVDAYEANDRPTTAGRWYTPAPITFGYLTASSNTLNSMKLIPIRMPPWASQITDGAFELVNAGTTNTSQNLVLGLFADDGTCRPTGTGLKSTSTSVTGGSTSAMTTVNLSWTGLTPGALYWMAAVRQGTGITANAYWRTALYLNQGYGDSTATPPPFANVSGVPAGVWCYQQASVTGAITSTTISTLTVQHTGWEGFPAMKVKYAA